MASVEKESGQFHEDAGKQVAASGKPAARKLSQAFKQALLKTALASKQDADKAGNASSMPAAEPTAASPIKPVSGLQPQSAETAPVGQTRATPETADVDPVEAALREAMGAAEESLAVEGGGAMGLEDDPDGEEGLSVEELETQESPEVDEALEIEEAVGVGATGESRESDGLDPVQAALSDAIEVVGSGDPVDEIVADQTAGGTPVDALEQLMAEQEASSDSGISAEELREVLLNEQTDLAPTAQVVDATTGKECADAVQGTDAPPIEPGAGSGAETLEYAGDHMEREEANADQSTPVVSNDDEGSPDVAAEEVEQALQATRNEIDAIASAFQEAASNLDRIEGDVCDVALATNESVLPAADPVDATGVFGLKEQVEMPVNEETPGSVTSSAQPASSGFSLPSFNMREELQTVRQTVQAGLEAIIRLLDRVDQTYVEAENRLAQARAFREAAQRAQEVSEKLVAAQTETAEARAAYESARHRLDEAQSAWEDARRAADDAAF